MTDEDWEHSPRRPARPRVGRRQLIGHASLVQRRLLHGGRALRTGYVEGVGVRADRRRRGHGAAMMAALERVVRGAYDLGALGATDEAATFYAGRGWQQWQGPTSALTPDGIQRTDDEDGCDLRPAGRGSRSTSPPSSPATGATATSGEASASFPHQNGKVTRAPQVLGGRRQSRRLARRAGLGLGRRPFTPGAPGAGDPFFPLAGNGGYDVRHYSLRLDYEPQNNALDARAVITARATQDLSRFDLDLRGLHVGRVTVDGAPAAFKRDGQELVITPAAGIRKRPRPSRSPSTTTAIPNPIIDPDKSKDGWIPTDDGAFVVNEPQGSPSWYPANDTPKDKATYDFAITVPEGRTAIANGLLVAHDRQRRRPRPGAGARATRPRPTWPPRPTASSRPPSGRCRAGCPEYNAVDPQTRSSGTRTRTRARLAAARAQRAGGRLFSRALRAVPVRERRRHRGLGAERLLLARVPDAADVLARSRARPRSSTRSRTCGSATRSRSRSGRTSGSTRASRPGRSGSGPSATAARRRSRDLRRAVRDPGGLRRGPGPLVPGAGRAAGPGGDVPHARLRPRRDDAAGAAREGRRRRVLHDPAHLVRGEPQRQRDDRGLHRARRAQSGRDLDEFFRVWLYEEGKPPRTQSTASSGTWAAARRGGLVREVEHRDHHLHRVVRRLVRRSSRARRRSRKSTRPGRQSAA